MLSTYTPMPTLAVKDLDAARQFYEGVLGFKEAGGTDGGVRYAAGSGEVLVYTSAYAGTNKATAVSFPVPPEAFEEEVAALRDRGVDFQTFDMEGATWSDGVATMGNEKGVWFEDPDGNILALFTTTQG